MRESVLKSTSYTMVGIIDFCIGFLLRREAIANAFQAICLLKISSIGVEIPQHKTLIMNIILGFCSCALFKVSAFCSIGIRDDRDPFFLKFFSFYIDNSCSRACIILSWWRGVYFYALHFGCLQVFKVNHQLITA